MATFSAGELALLRAHFQFYFDLDLGHRQPSSDKQHHFVRVCRNLDAPNTEHEAVYMRLKEIAHTMGRDVAKIAGANFELPSMAAEALEAEMATIEVRLCLVCKRPIHPERLEAIPNATKCVKCQSIAESASPNSAVTSLDCPRCTKNGFRSRLVWRTARDPNISGYFLGCSRFPDCRYTES